MGLLTRKWSLSIPCWSCDGRRIGAGPVCTDPVGREQGLVFEHLAEEALGRLQVAFRCQEEVNGRAVLVDSPVQVSPLAADLDVRLVNANRPAVRLAKGAQPALDQRRVGQDPTVQGGMVHRQAALQKYLLDVPVAERVTQIPRDSLQDQRCLEVPAFEVVFGSALQLLGDRTQDHRVPPNRRAKLTAMPDAPSTPEICDRPLSFASFRCGIEWEWRVHCFPWQS